jgi:uncharacterized protein
VTKRASDVVIHLRGEPLHLLPERAAFIERTATLLVADPHFGKSASFRAAGLAVPGGTTAGSLARLDAALARTGARRLVFLGDFFHARTGRVSGTLRGARGVARAAPITGGGAGPRQPRSSRRGSAARTADRDGGRAAPGLAPFALCHHPDPVAGKYVLAGHLHPAAVLRGVGRQRERLPCFWLGAAVGVLPAFGEFTGAMEVRPAPGDRVLVVAGEEVVEVA